MANTSVIVIPEGKICDYVDGKFRNDTPEEYVRQTIEKRLVNEHKYLPKQIRIEYTLQLGSRKPRADIVIFDKDCGEQTQENIKIIIECKKEAVEARNAKDGVEQLKSYMSACPNCEWGMWTVADGLFCREIDGLFCRSSPDIIVRRRCVLSHKRRGWLQPSPSFRYSRNLALQDELYHPVINNGPAVLVCVDKRLGTGPVNQSRDAG